MSDERLRELERSLALDPTDPERVEALVEERYRLGLPVSPKLYAERRYPPLRLRAPASGSLIAHTEDDSLDLVPSEDGWVDVPTHCSLRVLVERSEVDLRADLAQLGEVPSLLEIYLDLEQHPGSLPACCAALPQLESWTLKTPADGGADLRPLRGLRRLRSLTFMGPASLAPLHGGCARLEDLDVFRWSDLASADWEWFQSLPRLQALSSYEPDRPDRETLERLLRISGLAQLWLVGPAVRDEHARQMADLAQLRDLFVYDCPQVTARGFDRLAGCQRLESLHGEVPLEASHLRDLPASVRELALLELSCGDEGVAALRGRRLERLDLTGTQHPLDTVALGLVVESLSSLRELCLVDLGRLKVDLLRRLPAGLRTLNLARASAGSLEWALRLTDLEELRLEEPIGLNSKGLAALAQLPRLRRLELEGRPREDPCAALRQLRGLRSLELDDLPQLDLPLGALRGLDQLRELSLSSLPTVRDLRGLTELPALQELRIDDLEVSTDDLLQLLPRLPKLRELDLGVRTTIDSAQIRAQHPQLEVW